MTTSWNGMRGICLIIVGVMVFSKLIPPWLWRSPPHWTFEKEKAEGIKGKATQALIQSHYFPW